MSETMPVAPPAEAVAPVAPEPAPAEPAPDPVPEPAVDAGGPAVDGGPQPDADASAEPPAEPEVPIDPEAVREARQGDAAHVGRRLLFERINSTPEDQLEGPELALKRFNDLQTATETLADTQVVTFAEKDVLNLVDQDGQPLGKPLVVGVEIDGASTDVTVTRIVGTINRGGVARALVEYHYAKGQATVSDTGEVDWSTIVASQVVSEREALVGKFEGAKRTMVETFAARAAGEKPDEQLFGDAKLEETTATILKLAEETGLITGEDLVKFLVANPDIKAEQKAAIMAKLGESLIVTREVLQEAIPEGATGKIDTPQKAQEALDKVEKDIMKQREKLAKAKKTKDRDAEIEAQTEINKLSTERTQAQVALAIARLCDGENIQNGINKYFQMLEDGQISAEAAQKVRDAMRTGDTDKVFDAIAKATQKPGESNEDFEKRVQKYLQIQELKKKIKNGGGLLRLLAIVVTVSLASEVGGEVQENITGSPGSRPR